MAWPFFFCQGVYIFTYIVMKWRIQLWTKFWQFYSVAYITESSCDNGLNKTNSESPLKRLGWLDLDTWIAFRQILLLLYSLGSSVDDNVKTGKSLQEHLDKFSVIQSDSPRSLWQKHIENFIKTRVSSAVCVSVFSLCFQCTLILSIQVTKAEF